MAVNLDDIKRGISHGIERAGKEVKGAERELGDEVHKFIYETLNRWPSELSPRFVALFSELATIAALSRQQYQHPALGEDDLNAYLGHSILFFNSFRHK